MGNANTVTDGGMWRSHLEAALTTPGETVILASLNEQRDMVMQAATTRPRDLIDAARSLLEQAMERIQDELMAEDGDSQGDDPREQMVSTLDEVISMLPDPHADD
jgi:hypothetical protein